MIPTEKAALRLFMCVAREIGAGFRVKKHRHRRMCAAREMGAGLRVENTDAGARAQQVRWGGVKGRKTATQVQTGKKRRSDHHGLNKSNQVKF